MRGKKTSKRTLKGRDRFRIGTAGWSLASRYAADFPEAGSHLERYAGVFRAVEINTSFYRPHRRTTYEKWAAATPDDFRFCVKAPKAITHAADDEAMAGLPAFMDEISGLGAKLGPILIQLPPNRTCSGPCATSLWMMGAP